MKLYLRSKKKFTLLLLCILFFVHKNAFSQAPVFTTNPPDIIYACVGSNLTLSVVATNNPTSYYWRYTNFPFETDWIQINDDATYSGSTTPTLTILVSADLQSHTYSCVATNSSGATGSPTSTLYVSTGLPTQPSGIYGLYGLPDTTVCVPGSARTITYKVPSDAASNNANNHLTACNWTYSGSGVSMQSYPGAPDTLRITYGITATSGILSATASNVCGTTSTVAIPIHVNQVQSSLAGLADGNTVCSSGNSFDYYPDYTFTDASCNVIGKIVLPVTSDITACVTIDPNVQTYNGNVYVQRHYNIEALANPATTSATITLYFTQQDFDNYNAVRGALPALPTSPADVSGISHVRITQFHGTGTVPGTYAGTAGEIDPADNNIIWDAAANRWEITFDITGFSGFFISTGSLIPLPLTLIDFKGASENEHNLLQWITTSEINVSHFEIQRSADGNSFATIGEINAVNNSILTNSYSYTDNFNGSPVLLFYYRLKMVDIDGKFSYSKVVAIQPNRLNLSVEISPNPFQQTLTATINTPNQDNGTISITDISGKQVFLQNIILKTGANILYLQETAHLQKGMYFLNIKTRTKKQTLKILKE